MAARESPRRRTGTQSIERALLVLREIAARGRFGWGLTDLSARCGLDHSTTHRLLSALVRERLVQQRTMDRHYVPGPLIFELSLGMRPHAEFLDAVRPSITRLHRRHGAMAALLLRSDHDSVCALRAGVPPYVGARFEVGTRSPLLANAGGAAVLIALPPGQRTAIVKRNRMQLAHLGAAVVARLERMLHRSESLGYAFNQSEVTSGVHSIGLAVRGASAEVLGSVALSGQAEQFPEDRGAEVLETLRPEIDRIEECARRLGVG